MLKLRPYKQADVRTILSWSKDEEAFYKWTAGVLGDWPLTEEQFGQVSNLIPFTAVEDDEIVGFLHLENPGKPWICSGLVLWLWIQRSGAVATGSECSFSVLKKRVNSAQRKYLSVYLKITRRHTTAIKQRDFRMYRFRNRSIIMSSGRSGTVWRWNRILDESIQQKDCAGYIISCFNNKKV